MGVSVESADYVWRIDNLRRTPAAVRFLSLEPLLGPLDGLDLSGIHWAIGGGESGPGARPMRAEWMRSIRDQCIAAGVPFFCKQFGTWESNPTPRDLELDPKAKGGATLDGRLWREWPTRRR
jgi:protein gp37